MTTNMTGRILPADALAQLDARERQLNDVAKMLETLWMTVRVMACESRSNITASDVAFAADIYRDVAQLVETFHKFTEEHRK